jgi:nucleotidyltransferase/DNA polymerase involved in DNA repair
MGRVCCGLTPHLELARRPDLYGKPVVVCTWEQPVLCASPEAEAFGVRSGMSFRHAQRLCPDAEFVQPDPEAAERLRRLIAATLYDLSPVVEVHPGGTGLIALDGVVKPRQAIVEMRRRLETATGAPPRLGLAPGPFSARLAASRARPGRVLQVEDARRFLEDLPVAELELDGEQLERLRLLGLTTLGAVARLGPRQLETQLGPAARRAVLRARGLEPDRLEPWQPPQCTAAQRQFEPPVEDREALLFVALALAEELSRELGLRGAGAKRIRLRLTVEPGAVEERESIVRHPLSSTGELFGLLGGWIRHWQPGSAITAIAIELPELEAAGRRQLRLWTGGDGSREEVTATLERLQERFGEAAVVRPQPGLERSPVPAQRYSWVPV